MIDQIWNFITNDKVITAFISAVVSLFTLIVTLFSKNFIDTKVLQSKLETEHKFEQRKKIKEVLAKYKVHLINSGEILNHRLWNFERLFKKEWLNVNGKYNDEENYYFLSFVYRFINFFSWIKKIEKDMIFLDTTISAKEDLELIKFLKVFNKLFTDFPLVEDGGPDGTHAIDHFFFNTFDDIPNLLIMGNGGVKGFSDFKSEIESIIQKDKNIFSFFDGLSPLETRKRWDRIYLLHILLIYFLNHYGYDFQKTSTEKIDNVLNFEHRSKYLNNLVKMLKDYKLEDQVEVKKLIEKIAKLV